MVVTGFESYGLKYDALTGTMEPTVSRGRRYEETAVNLSDAVKRITWELEAARLRDQRELPRTMKAFEQYVSERGIIAPVPRTVAASIKTVYWPW